MFQTNTSHETSGENETPLLTPRSVSRGQRWPNNNNNTNGEEQKNKKNRKGKKSSKSYDENVDHFLAANQVLQIKSGVLKDRSAKTLETTFFHWRAVAFGSLFILDVVT
jgi:hypothetical protein